MMLTYLRGRLLQWAESAFLRGTRGRALAAERTAAVIGGRENSMAANGIEGNGWKRLLSA